MVTLKVNYQEVNVFRCVSRYNSILINGKQIIPLLIIICTSCYTFCISQCIICSFHCSIQIHQICIINNTRTSKLSRSIFAQKHLGLWYICIHNLVFCWEFYGIITCIFCSNDDFLYIFCSNFTKIERHSQIIEYRSHSDIKFEILSFITINMGNRRNLEIDIVVCYPIKILSTFLNLWEIEFYTISSGSHSRIVLGIEQPRAYRSSTFCHELTFF